MLKAVGSEGGKRRQIKGPGGDDVGSGDNAYHRVVRSGLAPL